MLRLKSVLLTFIAGFIFTHNTYAISSLRYGIPRLHASDVTYNHQLFVDEGRRLLFIGHHKITDRLAIWGDADLTEEMVRILLETPRDTTSMENLLRSEGNPWVAKNYQDYTLHYFLLGEPGQTSKIFSQAAENLASLIKSDSSLENIEVIDADGIYMVAGRYPKDMNIDCAYAPIGVNACLLIYESVFPPPSAEKGEATTRTSQKEIINYFQENQYRLQAEGINEEQIMQSLSFETPNALEQTMTVLKEELPQDHLIHRIERGSRRSYVGDERVDYYYLTEVVRSREELKEQLLDYLANNKERLMGEGITLQEITTTIGLEYVTLDKVENTIDALKEHLAHDKTHLIHLVNVADEGYLPDNKQQRAKFIHFDDKYVVLAYLKNHMERLHEGGIAVEEMLEDMKISWARLKDAKSKLSLELPLDHFIRKIELVDVGEGWERINLFYQEKYYRFEDALGFRKEIREQVRVYLEKNRECMKKENITLEKMQAELGFASRYELIAAIDALTKELSEDPNALISLYKIDNDLVVVNGQKAILSAFFERNKEHLQNLKNMGSLKSPRDRTSYEQKTLNHLVSELTEIQETLGFESFDELHETIFALRGVQPNNIMQIVIGQRFDPVLNLFSIVSRELHDSN